MAKNTWKIDGTDFPIQYVDRYYRERVLRMTRRQLASAGRCAEKVILRHETERFSQRAHDAYYFDLAAYNAWLRGMDPATEADVAAYCREVAEYGGPSLPSVMLDWRKSELMSMDACAAAAGIARSTWSDIECRRRKPTAAAESKIRAAISGFRRDVRRGACRSAAGDVLAMSDEDFGEFADEVASMLGATA